MKNFLKPRIVAFSLLLVYACLFSIGFMQSCSNSDMNDPFGDAPPKLKSLMTSSEYVTLNEQIKSFGKELRANYSKLSETKKERVINILNEMQDVSDNQESIDNLFDEFNFIMKIDFRTAIEKISEDAVKLRSYNEQNNISNQEYVLAVNKYPNGGIPRLKNGSEGEDVPTFDCVADCSLGLGVCLLFCLGNIINQFVRPFLLLINNYIQ